MHDTRSHYIMIFTTIGDYQSFDSLIVTPKMSVRDVIMIILNKLMITDNAHNFILIEKGQGTSEF